MKKIILCGSRKYNNVNFDSLVDNFEIIVRHNWLTNNHGYGKRYSDLQVLNDHMYRYWITNSYNLSSIIDHYKPYGQDKETIESYEKYITKCKNIVYFNNNNRGLLKDFKVSGTFGIKPRCGIASILHFVKNGIKPTLIGYSLSDDHFKYHATNKIVNKERDDLGHSSFDEISLIKYFHEKKLIDATLCMISENNKKIDIDLSTNITPTEEGLNLIAKWNYVKND